MSIESVLLKLVLDIEELEKYFNLLVQFEQPVNEHSSELVELYSNNILEKVENIVSYIYFLFKEYDQSKDKQNNITCALFSLLLNKLLFKLILFNNRNIEVNVSVLSKLNDSKSGIINNLKNLLDLIHVNIEDGRKPKN